MLVTPRNHNLKGIKKYFPFMWEYTSSEKNLQRAPISLMETIRYTMSHTGISLWGLVWCHASRGLQKAGAGPMREDNACPYIGEREEKKLQTSTSA